MIEVKAYKTKDGKIFENKDLAEKHELILTKVDSVMKLLGGYKKEIDPHSCDFINGKGYVIISRANMEESTKIIEELKKLVELPAYNIKNIRCYENNYIGVISEVLHCTISKENSFSKDTCDFIRYGSAYYANNPSQAGNKNYTK